MHQRHAKYGTTRESVCFQVASISLVRPRARSVSVFTPSRHLPLHLILEQTYGTDTLPSSRGHFVSFAHRCGSTKNGNDVASPSSGIDSSGIDYPLPHTTGTLRVAPRQQQLGQEQLSYSTALDTPNTPSGLDTLGIVPDEPRGGVCVLRPINSPLIHAHENPPFDPSPLLSLHKTNVLHEKRIPPKMGKNKLTQ